MESWMSVVAKWALLKWLDALAKYFSSKYSDRYIESQCGRTTDFSFDQKAELSTVCKRSMQPQYHDQWWVDHCFDHCQFFFAECDMFPVEKDKTQATETKMSSTHCVSENSTQRVCMYKTCTYLSKLMVLLSDVHTGPPPFLGHRFDVFQKEFQILICLTTEYFQWALTHIFISTTDKTLYPM